MTIGRRISLCSIFQWLITTCLWSYAHGASGMMIAFWVGKPWDLSLRADHSVIYIWLFTLKTLIPPNICKIYRCCLQWYKKKRHLFTLGGIFHFFPFFESLVDPNWINTYIFCFFFVFFSHLLAEGLSMSPVWISSLRRIIKRSDLQLLLIQHISCLMDILFSFIH